MLYVDVSFLYESNNAHISYIYIFLEENQINTNRKKKKTITTAFRTPFFKYTIVLSFNPFHL